MIVAISIIVRNFRVLETFAGLTRLYYELLSMVKETRIVFELTDLVMVRLHCPDCSGEVSQSLESTDPIPDHCTLCRAEWKPPSKSDSNAVELIRLIRRARRESTPRVSLRLELDAEQITQPWQG